MRTWRISKFLLALMIAAASPGLAADQVSGSCSIDGKSVSLRFATGGSDANLLDDSKRDTIIALSDDPLKDTYPADLAGLSLKSRKGDITALVLRIDGSDLANVAVFHRSLEGYSILPKGWFNFKQLSPAKGLLKLERREFDKHTYACKLEYSDVTVASPPVESEPTPLPTLPSVPTLSPASESFIDSKSAAALLVTALMNRDERQALELIKLGADPNGRDQSGIPVLNWAVMMCQPAVVQALVKAKADLNYERAPGMTILIEAGACPEAEKILRVAGAR